MKPILFNTEMVRAILAKRKDATRRLIKVPCDYVKVGTFGHKNGKINHLFAKKGSFKVVGKTLVFDEEAITVRQPYSIGDILYVRETWSERFDQSGRIYYKADQNLASIVNKLDDRWKPSIHMKKENARIFLKVTDIRIERIDELSLYDCYAEGIDVDEDQFGPTDYESYMCELDDALVNFGKLWDSTIQDKKYAFKNNPWVWSINFKRIDKPGEENETIP